MDRRITLDARHARDLQLQAQAAIAAQHVAQAAQQAAQQVAEQFNARVQLLAELNGLTPGELPRFDPETGELVLITPEPTPAEAA